MARSIPWNSLVLVTRDKSEVRAILLVAAPVSAALAVIVLIIRAGIVAVISVTSAVIVLVI